MIHVLDERAIEKKQVLTELFYLNYVLEKALIFIHNHPNSTNEHKTKLTQHSVKELRGYGLTPDL
ncbi:unnamed protein product, partial [Rotaria sordida]